MRKPFSLANGGNYFTCKFAQVEHKQDEKTSKHLLGKHKKIKKNRTCILNNVSQYWNIFTFFVRNLLKYPRIVCFPIDPLNTFNLYLTDHKMIFF